MRIFKPLISDPETLSQYWCALGLPSGYEIVDYVPDHPEWLPAYPVAILLVYPIGHCQLQTIRANQIPLRPTKDAVAIRQLIPNACSLIALLHAGLNIQRSCVGGSVARNLQIAFEGVNPAARGEMVAADDHIAKMHFDIARMQGLVGPQEQTPAPDPALPSNQGQGQGQGQGAEGAEGEMPPVMTSSEQIDPGDMVEQHYVCLMPMMDCNGVERFADINGARPADDIITLTETVADMGGFTKAVQIWLERCYYQCETNPENLMMQSLLAVVPIKPPTHLANCGDRRK